MILERQPNLKVLRDPPSLVGQRVRYVLLFHYDPENAAVARCKVRALAWTDPSLTSRAPIDKEVSRRGAEGVFIVAKIDFEKNDPNELRARPSEVRAAQAVSLGL